MSEKWHMAYSGSHMSAVRRILDTGDLAYGMLELRKSRNNLFVVKIKNILRN